MYVFTCLPEYLCTGILAYVPMPSNHLVEGDVPDPLPGCCKDSICHCGSDRRDAHLSHPRGTLIALNDMHIDQQHLIHLQDRIIMEVTLLDAPIFERHG